MIHPASTVYRSPAMHLATRGEVLLSLYDGAVRYGYVARAAIASGDLSAKGAALSSVMALVVELSNSLDTERAPEMCADLHALYALFIQRLQQAGLHMDVRPLDEVIGHLRILRHGWAETLRQA